MDERRIEEGLKRIHRQAEQEEIRKTAKAEQEPQLTRDELAILSREEEARQNERIKKAHPDDVCPVCSTHVADARYLVDPENNCVICGNCRVKFMPKSMYDLAVQALERLQQKKVNESIEKKDEDRIIVPKIVPNIKKT